MSFEHEFIHYKNQKVPLNWIVHSWQESTTTVLPHWHASFEISYTYSGMIENFTINSKNHSTEPGTVLLINSAEIHSAHSSYCSDLEALTIQIPFEFLNKLLPDFEYMRFVNEPKENINELNQLREILSKFYHSVKNEPEEFLEVQLMALTYEMIFLMAKYWMIQEKMPINSSVYNKKLGQIQEILSFVQENYAHDLSVDQIATEFHLSTNSLSKLFKRNLGLSVMKYVQLVRVNQAQSLLIQGEKSIQVISDQVGFPNEKSFRKAFEDIFHETPKKYQLSYKKMIKDHKK
ncbi:helix-turn-helix domain-containing protein [Vagococcus hydrophili]|uniref:AraC family transcriptional regulator n=1 Tax=Vagococcus hydrophili TaxID=2714947 RepID=A0A6G8AT60_9ENTE|nr:AraC family transcriptional regulator [Vagococcus hydrophili]QIL48177.1 AraC family transcriptional regulator [Vagococcus hydrophili]